MIVANTDDWMIGWLANSIFQGNFGRLIGSGTLCHLCFELFVLNFLYCRFSDCRGPGTGFRVRFRGRAGMFPVKTGKNLNAVSGNGAARRLG